VRGDWPVEEEEEEEEEEEKNLSPWYVNAGLWGFWGCVEDEGGRLIN